MNSTDKVEQAKQSLVDAENAAREAEPVRKAREALEQAQRELKEQEEAEREKKRSVAKEEEARRRFDHVRVLRDGLRSAGLKDVEIRQGDISSNSWQRHLPGVVTGIKGVSINLEEETSANGTWRRIATGRLICIVNVQGAERPRRFPQKQDGLFNFDKIAVYIKEALEIQVAQDKCAADKKSKARSAGEIAQVICQEYNLSEYGPVKAVVGHHLPHGPRGRSEYREEIPEVGKCFVSVGTLQCTPEQAREILDLLIKQGRITTSKKEAV